MNRRGFLKGLAAVVGGVALEEAIPFGRVWSFPKQVKVANKVPFGLKFHKNAFAFASEPLIQTFAFASEPLIQRIDVLYGFGELPPEAILSDRELAEQYRLDYAMTKGTGWLTGERGKLAGFEYDDETSLPSAF